MQTAAWGIRVEKSLSARKPRPLAGRCACRYIKFNDGYILMCAQSVSLSESLSLLALGRLGPTHRASEQEVGGRAKGRPTRHVATPVAANEASPPAAQRPIIGPRRQMHTPHAQLRAAVGILQQQRQPIHAPRDKMHRQHTDAGCPVGCAVRNRSFAPSPVLKNRNDSLRVQSFL